VPPDCRVEAKLDFSTIRTWCDGCKACRHAWHSAEKQMGKLVGISKSEIGRKHAEVASSSSRSIGPCSAHRRVPSKPGRLLMKTFARATSETLSKQLHQTLLEPDPSGGANYCLCSASNVR
jgi:hypothetical protein